MNENISKLKDLIEVYESEEEYLQHMSELWDEFGEPTCDPELLYKQENKIESAYNDMVDFTISLEKIN